MPNPPIQPFPPGGDDLLQQLWLAALAHERRDGDAGVLREHARALCAMARDAGIRPEQLIVAVKESWAQVDFPTSADARSGHALLSDVVSLCIREYYSPAGHSGL